MLENLVILYSASSLHSFRMCVWSFKPTFISQYVPSRLQRECRSGGILFQSLPTPTFSRAGCAKRTTAQDAMISMGPSLTSALDGRKAELALW